MMRYVLAGAILSAVCNVEALAQSTQASIQAASNLTITAINLRWFGQSGSPDRSSKVRAYLQQAGLMSDVMVFEEIVDKTMLQTQVLGAEYQCRSYNRSSRSHQYVVVCAKGGYSIELADNDNNFELEAIDTSGHLRPAVHGILKTRNGKKLAHIFGLHLKAAPEFSATRLTQLGKLVDYVQGDSSPIIAIGDYNTYANDPEQIERIFAGIGASEVETREEFSWASSTEDFPRAKFDRAWISDSMPRPSAQIVGPCNSSDEALLARYNADVSDHCALKLTFRTLITQ